MTSAEVVYGAQLFPLWGMVVLTVAIIPIAALIGWLLGRRKYVREGYDCNPPASLPGDATLGAMLALLGLLLAFTFSFVLSRAEARKVSEVEEAAAIGTAFLRADLLAEPGRREIQEAIAVYARTRLPEAGMGDGAIDSATEFDAFMQKTLEAQALLWPTAMTALGDDTSSARAALIASGITEVLDAHSRRLAANLEGLPMVIKVMIIVYATGALFLVGNHAALRGRRLSWRTFLFSMGVASVMVVIADFERPSKGFIQANHAVMRSTIAEIDAALALDANDS